MMGILTSLEPRLNEAGTCIIDELDEFLEVSFVQTGTVAIGYEINKVRKYCTTKTDSCVIGAFGVTFNQRAAYIYTAVTQCQGFFIRRANWIRNNKKFAEVGNVMKRIVLIDYLMNIRSKVMVHKRREIEKFMQRSDHQTILAVEQKDKYLNEFLIKDNFNKSEENSLNLKQKQVNEQQYRDYMKKYFNYGLENYTSKVR